MKIFQCMHNSATRLAKVVLHITAFLTITTVKSTSVGSVAVYTGLKGGHTDTQNWSNADDLKFSLYTTHVVEA
jgi:hypothetical protein